MCARQPSLDKIGKDIHRLDNRIKRYMDLHGNRRTFEAITGNNGRIICFLSEHEGLDIYQKDLEDEFGITRSTASRVVQLMEQKGLVERRSVAHDARLKKLVLTERSRELSHAMQREGDDMDRLLLRGFSVEEQAQLYQFLERMIRNLE